MTGSASGIGRAAALRLARDGYAVACLDIDEGGAKSAAEEILAAGGTGLGSHLDVSVRVGRRGHILRDPQPKLGPVRALVHSAGILHVEPALEQDARTWRQVIEVNLTGTFLCDQAAARLMVAAGDGGRIVNIASVHSQAPGRGLSSYDAIQGRHLDADA